MSEVEAIQTLTMTVFWVGLGVILELMVIALVIHGSKR